MLRATEWLTAAIEVIDSRIRDCKLTLVDTVADMASCARVLLGSERVAPADLDLRLVGVVMQPGHVIIPGAMHVSVPAEAGQLLEARFDRLVSVRFE
jgi:2-keto-4-pentenoate hydratase